MADTDYERIAREVLDAWNTQDPDRVVARYTPDLVYRDPNTRGDVRGADAFRRYLTKLFASWQMRWSAREVFPLRDIGGAAILWRASLTPVGGDVAIEVEGMDFVELEGERIKRNEVCFDRMALAAAIGSRSAA
jgi:hypothetical protein